MNRVSQAEEQCRTREQYGCSGSIVGRHAVQIGVGRNRLMFRPVRPHACDVRE